MHENDDDLIQRPGFKQRIQDAGRKATKTHAKSRKYFQELVQLRGKEILDVLFSIALDERNEKVLMFLADKLFPAKYHSHINIDLRGDNNTDRKKLLYNALEEGSIGIQEAETCMRMLKIDADITQQEEVVPLYKEMLAKKDSEGTQNAAFEVIE